jgi:hypothetical protein
MAVKDLSPKVSSTASSAALDRLNCFSDGIDTLVYELAEELAKKRMSSSLLPGRPIEIEVDDIEAAGELVIDAIKRFVAEGTLSKELGDAVESMEGCFKCHQP